MFLKKEMIYTKYVQSFCLFKISYKIFLLIIINILLINSSHSNEKKDILFIGDSLTSGYGLNKGKDFVSELNQITSKRYNRFNLINMGVSGDTTSGGLSRIEWSLSSNTEAVIIILGANDMLRGIPPEITKKNLNAMIEICFEKLETNDSDKIKFSCIHKNMIHYDCLIKWNEYKCCSKKC